jgi:hypothetical protein
MAADVSSHLTPTGRPRTYARDRKSDATIVRLRDLQIDMARQQVTQIGAMIADLDSMANTLEGEIEAEESRTRIHDPAHFAYSTLARATIVRRDNLKRSIGKLNDERAVAERALGKLLEGCQE